ncbi:putative gata transcription factor protein [Erysiphe neolycopersici]|uniref:Putative gata transcription factor protein n=1 Tax=Erysiphe neolycopersici TaxID=212602 RepID=A0A420I7A9_9PEZI|nr:putative gata transcription factor protein [Erysiphe neolycopersici]
MSALVSIWNYHVYFIYLCYKSHPESIAGKHNYINAQQLDHHNRRSITNIIIHYRHRIALMAAYEHDSYNEASFGSMKLKILYTFDVENKINHLARWPDVLSIRKFMINETTTIGVVELQTCLRAIIKASPELISNTIQDYTIYAHDYSECDYPLVGQGLLSKSLNLSSPVLKQSPHRPQQLLTGRVSNDINCIFTTGVKETLEVKMRLVPMPIYERRQTELTCKCKQSFCPAPNFPESVEWNTMMPKGSNSRANNMLPITSIEYQHGNESNIKMTSHMFTPKLQMQQRSILFHDGTSEDSGNESTETLTVTRKSAKSSKTSSKRGRSNISRASVEGYTSIFEEGTEGEEAVAPKKRAKVQKIKINNKSTVGQNSDSLKDTVDTSGSLRLFRPVPAIINHKNLTIGLQQHTLRLTTPTSYLSEEQDNVNSKPRLKLKLCRDSNLSYDPSRPIGKKVDLLHYSTESMDASSERNRSPFDTDTPPGMTSSPPLIKIPSSTRIRSSPPCPSSPCLPQLPRLDSGFMASTFEKLPTETDAIMLGGKNSESEAKKDKKSQKRRYSLNTEGALKQGKKEFIIEEECPGPMDQLPTKMPIFHQQTRARCATSRNKNVMSDDAHAPSLRRKSRTPSCKSKSKIMPSKHISVDVEDAVERSQPDKGPNSSTNIQQTSQAIVPLTSKNLSSRPEISASDPIMPQNNRLYPQNISGSLNSVEGQRIKNLPLIPSSTLHPPSNGQSNTITSQSSTKKEMIKQKLEIAIANGEMPPFCCNCGAIETPTWRKAWSKEMKGEPGYYEYSDEPGRVTAIIILTRDSEGKPTSYNLVKKYLGKDENQDDYNDYLLCNPCGIWMSKYKTSRPEERWESNSERASKAEPKKRPTQRVSKPKKTQNYLVPTPVSEASYFPSDAPSMLNDAIECTEKISPEDLNKTSALSFMENKPQSIRFLENLANKSSNGRSSAMPTTIQSSPVRSIGTRQSPIELEDDLGNTRRLLFPSPLKDEASKILKETITNSVTKIKRVSDNDETQSVTNEKENLTPKHSVEENIDARILQLFGEELSKEDNQRPKTPSQKSLAGTNEDLFKTPTRSSPTSRMITRSMSKSARSTKSSRKILELCRTPISVKQHQPPRLDDAFESPFTTTLNQLISDAKKNNPPGSNFDLTNLSTFSEVAGANLDMSIDFSMDDFFSTDMINSNACSNDFGEIEFNANSMDNLTADLTWQDLDCFNYDHTDGVSINTAVRPDPATESKEKNILENKEEGVVAIAINL